MEPVLDFRFHPVAGSRGLLSVAYVSSAVASFKRAERLALLQRARAFNARVDVTGLLLFHDGNFIQAIEGPEDGVATVMARVVADPRHRGIIELWRGKVTTRSFPDWRMGFADTAGMAADTLPEGFSRFLEGIEDGGLEPGPALALMRSFRDTLERTTGGR